MIESVVALLMFKRRDHRARMQKQWLIAFEIKAYRAERQNSEEYV